MKMETIIRSPQKGVISKLVHKEGVGTAIHTYLGSVLMTDIGYMQGWDCSGSI